ncbi:CHRD domain-containing protein [Arhodomonas sp. AD133]|uniref:CHRD domain-containing protein n=1 Tax=Arhodomonas sp. AD133 TaxID=3415009 RepID=UPI003EC057AD
MRHRQRFAMAVSALVVGMAFSMPVLAQGQFKTELGGFAEVPAISSSGSGEFVATVGGGMIQYTLSYADLATDVLQAHIHLGTAGTNGGVSVFLCTNVGGPAGTPACPPSGGSVNGVIGADDVIGPSGQGIDPGEFDEVLAALHAGVTYVNVHTAAFPAGEIRGQLGRGFGNQP